MSLIQEVRRQMLAHREANHEPAYLIVGPAEATEARMVWEALTGMREMGRPAMLEGLRILYVDTPGITVR